MRNDKPITLTSISYCVNLNEKQGDGETQSVVAGHWSVPRREKQMNKQGPKKFRCFSLVDEFSAFRLTIPCRPDHLSGSKLYDTLLDLRINVVNSGEAPKTDLNQEGSELLVSMNPIRV